MFFRGLGFAIPALFVIILTISLGGLFLVIAWARLIMQSRSDVQLNAPLPLWTFTAAVLLHCVVLPICWVIPDRTREPVLALFLIASFALVITSIALAGSTRWPGRGVVRIATTTLLAVNIIGLGAILFGLLG
jgi:hypothetical protein